MHVPANVDGSYSNGLGQATYSDQPSFLVWAWRKLTGYVEPLPVTPRYEILTHPAAPTTPAELELSRVGYYSPEVRLAIQQRELQVATAYEDYLRQLTPGARVEPAAPGEEPAIVAPTEFPWTILLIVAAGAAVLIAAAKRK